MSIETTLRNLTDTEIKLRAGNAGIFRALGTIAAKGVYVVQSNVNDTYKEYWCAFPQRQEKIILSSDDCLQWKEVVIEQVDDKIQWKGKNSRENGSGTSSTESTGGRAKRIKEYLFGRFMRPSGPPAQTNTNV